ncbi:MAG: AGE family epimerase/isomerase [Verrucomicrobia bacterium]|nr:AGE family epimerase/isomerase [Verrucomicrobiota bacterium]
MKRPRVSALVAFIALLALLPNFGIAAPLADSARGYKIQLAEKILPYWFDTAQDTVNGGYLLSDDFLKGRSQPKEKQLVSQARMIWTFSLVHRKGYSDARRNYLKAAEQGYRFLLDHFRDQQHGGYFWKTDLDGKATKELKIVYGQSFVIYALVEYYRASGDKAALQHAMDLFQTLQKRSRDPKHGGWVEHFQRDWTALALRDPAGEVEVAGLKSANTHLHLMEALTELYEATHDGAVRQALEESVKLNATYFYPPDAAQSCFHRHPDWTAVTDRRSAGLSYGHNVEFAWLMVRAEQVLGRPPSWKHFYAHLDHALKIGWDEQRGGLYHRGVGNEPPTDTGKVWWVQAEMLATLTDALVHQPEKKYEAALAKLLDFLAKYQADPKDGIWLDTVTAEGQPKSPGKAHSWKANYHDVRAIQKFVEAFHPGAK